MSEIAKYPIYIVDASNEAAMRAVRKLSGEFRPGAIIPLEADEYAAMLTSVVQIEIDAE